MCSGRVLGHWCRVIDVVDACGALERIGDLRENGGKYGDIIASGDGDRVLRGLRGVPVGEDDGCARLPGGLR